MTARVPPVTAGPTRRSHWGRLFAFVSVWVVIIVVGRAVVPSATRADTASSDAADEGVLVGSLVNREYVVRISATAAGPRYTVSTLSGQILMENLDAKALARAFPRLDPANLQATPEGPGPVGALMQADTGEKPQN